LLVVDRVEVEMEIKGHHRQVRVTRSRTSVSKLAERVTAAVLSANEHEQRYQVRPASEAVGPGGWTRDEQKETDEAGRPAAVASVQSFRRK
jgi:hypothetical protein